MAAGLFVLQAAGRNLNKRYKGHSDRAHPPFQAICFPCSCLVTAQLFAEDLGVDGRAKILIIKQHKLN